MSSSITILGSTGSIGKSTLRVLNSLGGRFQVYGLACYKNILLLEKQIEEFQPRIVAVGSSDIVCTEEYKKLKSRFSGVEFLEGSSGLNELAEQRVDILVSAIVGAAGLAPTLAAVPNVRRIALANKETLVMAGDIFIRRVKEYNVELIPVDSEHSAIFSLIENLELASIRRIILTASGGSLRERPFEEFDTVTSEEALAHPTWNMGSKITIDSATLMNKGLEVIEAHHLFELDYSKIDVIIHPESIIHSMVETIDGSIFAQMSVADMALPICNALEYPEKRENHFGRLELEKVKSLNFIPYDSKKFPALRLCYLAGNIGGTMPAVLNAANEIAVSAFLCNEIIFTDIIKIVEKTMDIHNKVDSPDISAIFDADRWARETARRFIIDRK